MKHKVFSLIFSFAVIILSGQQSYAQKIETSTSTDYTQVKSYLGITSPAFRLQVAISPNNVNFPNWALMVRVNGPIKNGEGKEIEPRKISIRIKSITGDGPTIQQLGIQNNPIPLSQVNQPIVQSSLWALSTGPNNYYRQFLITFDIIIAGGSYLENLKTYNAYTIGLTFSILDRNSSSLSQSSGSAGIQIVPEGTPPVDPVYSIQVNSNANNGLLEFKSISDYVNGVSQIYTNGLSVISSTPYALQVKAQSSAFESLESSIPLNTVSLNLKAVNNSSVAGTVQLSNAAQTIINSVINSGTQARAFDIRYFTSPSDTRLQNAKPDMYRATLIYTLIPQ